MAFEDNWKGDYEHDPFPTKIGPRLMRPKFGPGKLPPIDNKHSDPPNFNGDEGVHNLKNIYLHAHENLGKAVITTQGKKQLLLSEGLLHLNDQWDSLETKENQFRGIVKKFNTFIKENVIKRERFFQSTRRSQEHYNKYKLETEKMKENNSYLKKILEQMNNEIKKHSIYENFLRTVTVASSDFKTVYSLVNRCRVLMATLEDTTAKFVKNKFLLLDLMQQLTTGAHQKSIVTHETMNRLCTLGPLLADVTARNIDNEKIICDVHREVTKSMNDVHCTLEILNYMYQYMCAREMRRAFHYDGDYKTQLMVLKRTLGNFEKMLEICKPWEH